MIERSGELPDGVDELKALTRATVARADRFEAESEAARGEVPKLKAEVNNLAEANATAKAEIARLTSILKTLRRGRFGKRSALRASASRPLMARSIPNSASIRLTSSNATGDRTSWVLPCDLRRAAASMSAGTKNLRRAAPGTRLAQPDRSPGWVRRACRSRHRRQLAECRRSSRDGAEDARRLDLGNSRTPRPAARVRRRDDHRGHTSNTAPCRFYLWRALEPWCRPHANAPRPRHGLLSD